MGGDAGIRVALVSEVVRAAVALWVAATHAQPAWEHAPRLAVVSPLKRCGKSRLLDVVAETCWAPLITVNATIAAVVRSIGADPPTLLVDEADTLWGTRKQADTNEDLRGLLNAGHQRNRPMLRWDVTSRRIAPATGAGWSAAQPQLRPQGRRAPLADQRGGVQAAGGLGGPERVAATVR